MRGSAHTTSIDGGCGCPDPDGRRETRCPRTAASRYCPGIEGPCRRPCTRPCGDGSCCPTGPRRTRPAPTATSCNWCMPRTASSSRSVRADAITSSPGATPATAVATDRPRAHRPVPATGRRRPRPPNRGDDITTAGAVPHGDERNGELGAGPPCATSVSPRSAAGPDGWHCHIRARQVPLRQPSGCTGARALHMADRSRARRLPARRVRFE